MGEFTICSTYSKNCGRIGVTILSLVKSKDCPDNYHQKNEKESKKCLKVCNLLVCSQFF